MECAATVGGLAVGHCCCFVSFDENATQARRQQRELLDLRAQWISAQQSLGVEDTACAKALREIDQACVDLAERASSVELVLAQLTLEDAHSKTERLYNLAFGPTSMSTNTTSMSSTVPNRSQPFEAVLVEEELLMRRHGAASTELHRFYSGLTVTVLKQLAALRGLPVSGPKRVLSNRLTTWWARQSTPDPRHWSWSSLVWWTSHQFFSGSRPQPRRQIDAGAPTSTSSSSLPSSMSISKPTSVVGAYPGLALEEELALLKGGVLGLQQHYQGLKVRELRGLLKRERHKTTKGRHTRASPATSERTKAGMVTRLTTMVATRLDLPTTSCSPLDNADLVN